MNDAILEARHVAKSFPTPNGKIEVLRDVSLCLKRGSSLSITGASGSGKTTLLNILSALEAPDTGTVHWGGNALDMSKLSSLSRQRGKHMGLVFQTYYLMPEINALENVYLAKRIVGTLTREDRAWGKELLDKVGLSERATQTPAKLSGGERQRVALARALINRPELILADEPTGNLDEKTGERVMELLLNLCEQENVALLLVTHNANFAARTDDQLHLSEGVLNHH